MQVKSCKNQICWWANWTLSYLQRGVKNDQFGAGRNGIIAGVSLHEVHVDEGVGVRLCRGPKRRGCVSTHTYNRKHKC